LQSVELTHEAIDFLKTTFESFDADLVCPFAHVTLNNFTFLAAPQSFSDIFSTDFIAAQFAN
jgi:hypothetical protein